jgi:hypothetical protein
VTQEEPLQNYQPRSTFSTWIGVVLLFAFFGLLALVVIRAAPRGDTYEEKRAKARVEKLEAAQKENMAALTTYAWVDKTKGIARIPIENAMQLTVAELAQKSPAPAGPIATAETSPVQAATSPAAPATSPAPGATASPATSAGTTPKPTSVTGPDSESRNQPAAAIAPPPAPPGSQPGPSTTPAASPPSAATKAQVSPAASPAPSAPGTPLPVRGKTP